MKPKTIIVLVIALLVCSAYLVWKFAPKSQPKAEAEKKLFVGQFAPVKVQITGANGIDMTFVDKNGIWWFEKPFVAQADQGKFVSEMLHLFNTNYTTLLDRVNEKTWVEDSQSGLDKPNWTLTATDADGKTRTLLIGKALPAIGLQERGTYARPEGSSNTYVIDSAVNIQLDQPLKSLREHRVLPVERNQIFAIELRGKQDYRLQRVGDKWQFASPAGINADTKEVEKLIDSLTGLLSDDFSDVDIKSVGLDKPSLVISVDLLDSAASPTATSPATVTRQIMLNKINNNVYAKIAGEPTVYVLPAASIDSCQPRMTSLRDKSILGQLPSDIAKIDVNFKDSRIILEKTTDAKVAGKWTMTEPFVGPANEQAVEKLIENADKLSADQWIDARGDIENQGIANPRGSITFTQKNGSQPIQLLIGQLTASGEMTFVKSQSSTSIAMVKTPELSKLTAGANTYWPTKILSLADNERAIVMTLSRRDGVFHLQRGTDEMWSFISPKKAPTEPEPVNKILESLRTLNAESIVSLGTTIPADYLKNGSLTRLTFTTEKDAAPTTAPASSPASASSPTMKERIAYSVSAIKEGDSTLVWLDGEKPAVVGKFPASLYDTLNEDLRNRDVTIFNPKDISAVRILAGKGGMFELVRKSSGWESAADPLVQISSAKVNRYLESICKLTIAKYMIKTSQIEKWREIESAINNPWVVVHLTDAATNQPIDIIVADSGPDAGRNNYVVISGVDGVCVVDNEAVVPMLKSLDEFKK